MAPEGVSLFERHPPHFSTAVYKQILYALATGYITECNTRTNAGTDRTLSPETILEQLKKLTHGFSSSQLSRSGRESLQCIADVLGSLIADDWHRYRPLKADWPGLRARLLQSSPLAARPPLLEAFTSWLFWDDEPAMVALHRNLNQARNAIQHQTRGLPIACSHEVAALLLDIDTHKRMVQHDAATMARVAGIQAVEINERCCLGATIGLPVFRSPDEFGCWQALIWELTLPVNHVTIPSTSPARALFEAADLLDFPGVALAQPGGVRPRVGDLSAHELFTTIVKRGKTASMVATRSRELGIDGFSILLRLAKPPAQPDQLIAGLRAWHTALDFPTLPQDGSLPLNVILTFASSLINAVHFNVQGGHPPLPQQFNSIIQMLDQLGEYTRPASVHFFTVTYPRFPDGLVTCSQLNAVNAASLLAENELFQERFGRNSESLTAMAKSGHSATGDGGTDYLLRSLAAQAQGSQLRGRLLAKAANQVARLNDLLTRALPPQGAADSLMRQHVENWSKAIRTSISTYRERFPGEDAAAHISLRLRQLLNVDPEDLEPIPLQCAQKNVTPYLQLQFDRWRQVRQRDALQWAELGLPDAATVARLLGYLSRAAIARAGLVKWLRNNLGHISSDNEARHARRFLAMQMAEVVCFGLNGRATHRPFASSPQEPDFNASTIQPRLHAYALRERRDLDERVDMESPHYFGFVEPFLSRLQQLHEENHSPYTAQPGDVELTELVSSIAS